jgi:leucyl/phenylalanyl-tRNA--protein transferase
MCAAVRTLLSANSSVSRRRSINLSAPLLLEGYRRGLFPMALEDGEIGWFSPDPRGIIPLEPGGLHISHGLRRALRKNRFGLRINGDFESVIRACARRTETWISEEIIRSYRDLHLLGYAHSVECWLDGELAGGLYGVALRGVFFGESMFHTVTDASKVALVLLVERLRARGYTLLDLQWTTPHLKSFGALDISRAEYLQRLATALQNPCEFV